MVAPSLLRRGITSFGLGLRRSFATQAGTSNASGSSGKKERSVVWLALIPATTFGLGVWQLYRLKWKTDLIDTIELRYREPPLELTLTSAGGDALEVDEQFRWRRVTFTGEFQHDKELHVSPRTFKGINGLHVVTPLRRVSDGTTILVNRGFIPGKLKNPDSRPLTLTEGEVTVVGILRDGQRVWLSLSFGTLRGHT